MKEKNLVEKKPEEVFNFLKDNSFLTLNCYNIKTPKLKLDFKDSKYATGRRKTSIARVWIKKGSGKIYVNGKLFTDYFSNCLLYTSDAADDTPCVDLGGRRIIKKKLSFRELEASSSFSSTRFFSFNCS